MAVPFVTAAKYDTSNTSLVCYSMERARVTQDRGRGGEEGTDTVEIFVENDFVQDRQLVAEGRGQPKDLGVVGQLTYTQCYIISFTHLGQNVVVHIPSIYTIYTPTIPCELPIPFNEHL